MSDVELYWFDEVLSGNEVEYPFDPGQTGADFDNPGDRPATEVRAIFDRCVARSKDLVSAIPFATMSKKPRWDGGFVNLCFVAVHLIEECARHCRHADLIRDVIDGETGH